MTDRVDNPLERTTTAAPPPPGDAAVYETYEASERGATAARDDEVKVIERPRADRIRWGPIWAGLVTTLATFLFLQLALFATDAVSLDINPTASENALPFWTALAAIVAFILGGVVTGASSRWGRADDGLLQGIVMWALAVVVLVAFSVIGASALASGLGSVLGDLDAISTAVSDVNSGDANVSDAAIDDARDTAAAAALFLGITLMAAGLGAVIGSGLWPRRGRANLHVADDRNLARR